MLGLDELRLLCIDGSRRSESELEFMTFSVNKSMKAIQHDSWFVPHPHLRDVSVADYTL